VICVDGGIIVGVHSSLDAPGGILAGAWMAQYDTFWFKDSSTS
jgi:hypothetical protein